MSVAEPRRRDAAAPIEKMDAPTEPAAILRILVAVDSSECTGRVMKWLIGLYVGRGPIEVILLNVQPKPQDWRMRGYGWFQREAIHDRLINDRGKRVISSAARHLDSAGVPHKDRIELGDTAETILRCAREEDCQLIMLAEPRPGVGRRWLMRTARLSIGSIAALVIHLARVPVIIVP